MWREKKEIQDMEIKKQNSGDRIQETEEKLLFKFSTHLQKIAV
jgi:hypothetical protein